MNLSARSVRRASLAAVALASTLALAACSSGGDKPKPPPSTSASPDASENDKDGKNGKSAVHWSYEGAHGPDKWGDMGGEFATCKTGREQSPVDLTAGKAGGKPASLSVDYKPVPLKLENNGHTIQATVPAGSKITVDGAPYELQQFHFHLPSEHTVKGQGTAMELHFVHKNAEGKLAVLGVLMKEQPGASAFAPLWKALPDRQGKTTQISEPVDLNKLLPAGRGSYQYAGSLTTPPCSEGVKWTVLKETVTVSPEEAAAYRKLFPKTNRPVQPHNDRELTTTER
ncbi:carbonic anhydrase [Streptomyces sp. HUAS TT7]|uniref:carbonic anhydrase n=1 Tax=Streptomyces sp. HUAS TT7 TaxID=3447507 RepID=UPI003F656AA7